MDEINKEQAALDTQLADLGGRIAGAEPTAANISSAERTQRYDYCRRLPAHPHGVFRDFCVIALDSAV